MIHIDADVLDREEFVREMGMVVSTQNHGLHLVAGTPGSVDFPAELITDLHKKNPGIVHELAHTHPTGMWNLSHRDELTLKSWAFALHPFPARLSVIAFLPDRHQFSRLIMLGMVEAKETWLARGKKTPRKYQQIAENMHYFDWYDDEPLWVELLLRESFSQIDNFV
jgi:hypothetical protein